MTTQPRRYGAASLPLFRRANACLQLLRLSGELPPSAKITGIVRTTVYAEVLNRDTDEPETVCVETLHKDNRQLIELLRSHLHRAHTNAAAREYGWVLAAAYASVSAQQSERPAGTQQALLVSIYRATRQTPGLPL